MKIKKESFLDKEILFSPRCRFLATNLLNDNSNNIFCTDQLITEKSAKENFELFIDKDFSFSNFIRLLVNLEIIDVKDIFIVNEKNEFLSEGLYVDLKVKDNSKILDLCDQFNQSTIDEPYGENKQVEIVKNSIKEKFLQLENDFIKLTQNNFEEYQKTHINFIGTLILLKRNGFIDFYLDEINLNVEEMFESPNGTIDSYPVKFGVINFIARINIKTKLTAEWASGVGSNFADISYSEETGNLLLEGRKYSFFTPGTIISELMSKLVENVNSLVSSDELASITSSKSIESIRQDFSKGKKNELNKITKRRINEIRRRISNYSLSKKISIVPNHGYKLVYSKSEIDNDKLLKAMKDAEDISDEIPF